MMKFQYLRKKIFTTPNIITLFRFGLIFLLFWVWFNEKLFNNEVVRIVIVIFLYTLGGLSDYIDGYWARRYLEKSKVGAFMDSLVDKFFTLSFFVVYLYIDLIEVWWVWVAAIMIREIYITGMRIYATLNKLVLVTERHGKNKMVLQVIFQLVMWLYLLIFAIIFESTEFQKYLLDQGYSAKVLLNVHLMVYLNYFENIIGVSTIWINFFRYFPNILLFGVTVFTVYSGVNYILKNRQTKQV